MIKRPRCIYKNSERLAIFASVCLVELLICNKLFHWT